MGLTPAQPEPEPAGSETAVTAALAYLWFPAILWLLIDSYKKNRFVRFHSFQALALGVLIVLVSALLSLVPVLAIFLLALLGLLLYSYEQNRIVRFHSFRVLVLGVVIVLVGTLLSLVPGLSIFLVILWNLFAFALWVMCVVMAVKGEWFKLPVIGDFAEVEFRRIPTKRVARPTLKCAGCSREPLPGLFVPGRVVAGDVGFGRCEKCGKVWCWSCTRRYDHGSYYVHHCPRCDEELSSDLLGE